MCTWAMRRGNPENIMTESCPFSLDGGDYLRNKAVIPADNWTIVCNTVPGAQFSLAQQRQVIASLGQLIVR